MARYIVRRTRNDTKVVFGRAARRVGRQPLGECLAIGNGDGTINIKNLVETDSRGLDFFELKNITHTNFWTRTFDVDRKIASSDQQVGGHTSEASVVTALNLILGTGISRALSPIASGTIGVVNVGTEKGTDGSASSLLDELSNDFILESGSDTIILTHSDGTITDIDARSVVQSGGVGNPVVSGAVSGTDLVLTLNDASTVTIDATKMVNGTEAIISLPNWYQTYANPGAGSSTPGSQISTTLPPSSANPYYFGTTLKRGYEFLFDVSFNSETIYFGIWGGSTTYTPNSAGLSSLWTKKIRYGSGNDEIRHGTEASDTIGFDLSADYSVTHGTTKLALRYDYDTNKLQLWDRTDDRWRIITTASVAEDGNPVTISFANSTAGGGVPNFTVREQTYTIIAQLNAGADTTWRDGILTDTVITRNAGLLPGQKMTITTPVSWQNHFLGFDYSGAVLGQTSVETNNTACVQLSSAEKISEKIGFTINTQALRYDSGIITDVMGGAKIAFRYHTDNSFDLYDEDNEEVLFTKDADMDGSTVFLHMYASTNINIFNMLHAWTDDVPFDNVWYKHHLDHSYQAFWFTAAKFNGGGAYQKWGETMYPGQELVWTHYQPSNITELGIRNTANSGWLKRLDFSQTDVTNGTGFDLTAAYTENENILLEIDASLLLEDGYNLVLEDATLATKWALRYDYGDKKLKLYQLETALGKETLITTANVAEDGNGIIIHGGGAGRGWIFEHRYYGWEYVHTPIAYPQPWRNWRLDRPTSSNTTIVMDTVLKSRRSLNPGYYMRWRLPQTSPATFWGGWKSSNAASGIANVEAFHTYWDHGLKETNVERIQDELGWTLNAGNSNFVDSSPDYWQDPNPGSTDVQFRYHANTNKIDLHDHTNNAVIATKNDDGDGNGIYISAGYGHNISSPSGVADDFMGGGDVTIATSTFAPTFTNVLNYGDDGILHQGEMISIDTTVPAGKRLILTPDFWGLNDDQSGIAGSGPGGASGWQEADIVNFGWQKANSPFVGTNIGTGTSGWDAGVRFEMRGAGAGHASRIRLYSDGEATFTTQDSRSLTNNYTDLYFTFDRISSSSGRIMAFTSLAAARIGVTGDNTQLYGSDDNYMNGTASTLALTGDLNVYVYSNTGSWTLPIVPCTEVVTIPT